MKQRYLKAGHKQIPVTEDVYLAAARWKENLVRNTRSNGLAPDDLLIRNSTHIAASADEQGFGVMRCEGRGMAYMGLLCLRDHTDPLGGRGKNRFLRIVW